MTEGLTHRTAGNGATVSAGLAQALADFAVARGVEEAALLARAGLAAGDLQHFDARLPFARYVALTRAAAALSGNPALSLEFGADVDSRRFSIASLIAHASATMNDALVQINRYGRLVVEVEGLGDGPRFEIVRENGQRWMIDRRADPDAFPELTEATWSRFICWTRKLFPQATYALAAEVTYAAPGHRAAYERIWQVPITFGAPRNAIRTSLDWGELPVAPEGRYAFGVLTERADVLLEELEKAQTMRGRVENLLLPLLHTGDVRIDAIARAMQTSRQTLYRSLKAEGVTFEQVLDDLRHRMALRYLAGKRVSVNETAYLVGFSDASAFSRAFKRWTGVRPATARSEER
jgi:AraC-like DNA-binding protein